MCGIWLFRCRKQFLQSVKVCNGLGFGTGFIAEDEQEKEVRAALVCDFPDSRRTLPKNKKGTEISPLIYMVISI